MRKSELIRQLQATLDHCRVQADREREFSPRAILAPTKEKTKKRSREMEKRKAAWRRRQAYYGDRIAGVTAALKRLEATR